MRALPEGFTAAVGELHRVAEEVVAPARKPANEIALQATPGGWGTPPFAWEGSIQQVRVEGATLVYERREPLDVDHRLAGEQPAVDGPKRRLADPQVGLDLDR